MTDQPSPSRPKTFLADLGLFYAAAIWGSTFFIVKGVLEDIDPVILVGYRFLFAGLLLLAYLKYSRKPVFKELKKGLFLSAILWLLYIPQTIGLEITTASNSGFITGLFVAFVPIFILLLFKRRPTLMESVGAGISLVGLWVLTGGLTDMNAGDMMTLITAATYALHILYSDKYIKQGIDPIAICCQQFLFVGIFSLIVGIVFDLPFTIGSGSAVWIILFLAIFPTMTAFVIQMIAQKITLPLKVALILALEPVFAAVFAWTLGGEEIVRHRAVGGLFIFAAIFISQLKRSSTKSNRS